MAHHKFTYTVSGVSLSDDQKSRISQAIASAVAGVLAGESPGQFSTDSLTLGRIYGGIWIFPPDVGVAEGQDTVFESVRALAT